MKKAVSAILALVMCLTTIFSINVFAAEKATISEGIYTIQSKLGRNMVLDIADGSKASGANVQLYKSNGTTAQMFWIEREGSYYTIRAMNSGLVLDVQNGTMKSGTNVWQYTANGSKAQKWNFYSTGTGYYFIGCGNFALDVSGGKSSNGTNVQIYTPNGSAAQCWKLNRVISISPKNINSFKAATDSEDYCIVKINDSLISKKGKQTAKVTLKTYNYPSGWSTNGKVRITLKDMAGRVIWSGTKKGGDTIKLGDDYPAYKIYVEYNDLGPWGSADRAKAIHWGIANASNCTLHAVLD